MYCPKCGRQVEDNAMFCAGCGCRVAGSAETPKRKTSGFALASLICGVAGVPVCAVGLPIILFRQATGWNVPATVLFVVSAVLAVLAVLAVVFGMLGIIRSVRTGGEKKNVKGIVFAAIGLYLAVNILVVAAEMLLAVFLGVEPNGFTMRL